MIQDRFVPVDVPRQILFLFTVMNDFLRGISADLVFTYEHELFSFLNKSVFSEIFQFYLRNDLKEILLTYLLSVFNDHFKTNYLK